MPRRIITLLTDFGLKDPYVAQMKAVILSINPNAEIVDMTHQIDKFDIRMGAYVLSSAFSYFPRGSIHVAVVDPGVGTKRRAILIKTMQGCFVGPDNGILALAVKKAKGFIECFEITNAKFMMPEVSTTFHGRDVFASAAAYLSRGKNPSQFGPPAMEFSKPEFSKIIRGKDIIKAEVIHVDDFGNIITNLTEDDIESFRGEGVLRVELAKVSHVLKICKDYADVEPGKTGILIGSHGFLELFENQASAAETLGVQTGDLFALKTNQH